MVEGRDGTLLCLNIKDQLKLFSIHHVRMYNPSITPASAASGKTITDETTPSRDSEPAGTATADVAPRNTGTTTPES